MRKTLLVSLCVILSSWAATSVANAQEETSKEKPRFFFEGGQAAAPAAADEAPVVAFGFEAETDLSIWRAVDAEALVELDAEPGVAFSGEACLRMTHVAREGVFQQLSARPLTVPAAMTLSFAIGTDLPTNLSFGVVERDGAFYQQFAALPGGEWTRVSVPLSSLVLSQDTQDLSGVLEPDQIVEVRLADLANLPGALGDALGRKTGLQRLFLDEVGLSTRAEARVAGTGDPRLFVEGFEGGAIGALAIGGARLEQVPEGEGHILHAVAEGRASRWQGLVMAVGHLDLRMAEALSLALGASEPLVVNVTLEERDGSKYSQRVAVEGEAVGRTLPLDALVLETDSDDENGRLDREQIRVLVVVADMARAARVPALFSLDDVQFR